VELDNQRIETFLDEIANESIIIKALELKEFEKDIAPLIDKSLKEAELSCS
jgi:hypothetical protein